MKHRAANLSFVLPIAFLAAVAGPAPATGGEEPSGRAAMRHMMSAQSDAVEVVSPGEVIPLVLQGNRPIVPVMIGAKGPFPFILDTGAGGSVVSQSLADELGLTITGDARVGTPMSPEAVEAKAVLIKSAVVGGIRIEGLRAVTMDLEKLFAGVQAPRGVLSAKVFEGYLVTLDYPQKQVTIRKGELPAADSKEVFEFDPAGHLPAVPLDVAGEAMTAHIDSGSPAGFMLPKESAKKLPLASEPVKKGRIRTASGESDITESTLKGTIRLGRYTFENPEVRFGDTPPNLGFEILSRFAITLDPKLHRVRLSGAPDVVTLQPRAEAGPQRKRYGLKIHIDDSGAMAVDGTDPGSPAEKAGLKEGDRIVSVNGVAAEELEQARLAMFMRASPVKLVIERDGKKSEIEMKLD